jgi:hypothetical protein
VAEVTWEPDAPEVEQGSPPHEGHIGVRKLPGKYCTHVAYRSMCTTVGCQRPRGPVRSHRLDAQRDLDAHIELSRRSI